MYLTRYEFLYEDVLLLHFDKVRVPACISGSELCFSTYHLSKEIQFDFRDWINTEDYMQFIRTLLKEVK